MTVKLTAAQLHDNECLGALGKWVWISIIVIFFESEVLYRIKPVFWPHAAEEMFVFI